MKVPTEWNSKQGNGIRQIKITAYSFPVKDKFPKIGGIGPTSLFSLKSLHTISSLVTEYNTRVFWSFDNDRNPYKTASACIRPMTSGIFPVNLLP